MGDHADDAVEGDLMRGGSCAPENLKKDRLVEEFEQQLKDSNLGFLCDAGTDIGKYRLIRKQVAEYLARHFPTLAKIADFIPRSSAVDAVEIDRVKLSRAVVAGWDKYHDEKLHLNFADCVVEEITEAKGIIKPKEK